MAGVTLGIMFAFDASYGPRSRQVHVMANLFGRAGLLISGFGYHLLPEFAERALRWPGVQALQVALLRLGLLYAKWPRMYLQRPGEAVEFATLLVGTGMLMFTAQVMVTFSTRYRHGTSRDTSEVLFSAHHGCVERSILTRYPGVLTLRSQRFLWLAGPRSAFPGHDPPTLAGTVPPAGGAYTSQ